MINEKLRAVFAHLGVSITTLAEAHEFAQRYLLRTTEVWEPREPKEFDAVIEQKQELLYAALHDLGMIKEVAPISPSPSYTYILLMGGLTEWVHKRFDYLAELKLKGISYQEIILVGGERLLQDFEKQGLPEWVTTEGQMMQYIIERHPVLCADTFRLISAPLIRKDDGTYARPTTLSSLVHCATKVSVPGSCLVVTNNPYVLRQTKIAQKVLSRAGFIIDGAGSAYEYCPLHIFALLDEFARLIYEEYHHHNSI